MSKKKTLILLISSFGLIPENIEKYKAGHHQSGWRVKAIDMNNEVAIDFDAKEGFKAAFKEIVNQGKIFELAPAE